MPKNVLIVSTMFPPQVVGGAEIVAHRQARMLQAQGHQVTVFAGGLPDTTSHPGSLSVATVDGLLVYRLTLRSLDPDGNFHLAAAGRRLASVMAAHRPGIVHFHNVLGLGANLIPVAARAGARTVVTLHDHWGFCFKNTLLRNDGRLCDDIEQCALCLPRIKVADGAAIPIRLRRDYVAWCLDQADVRLSPSAYMAAAYGRSGVTLQPVRHLSNGIDLDGVPVTPKRGGKVLNFVCFSYLGEHKGIPTLLDAAERLAQDDALAGRWHLTIAGDGHLAQTLRHDIAEGRFGHALTYAGRLPHSEALELAGRSDVVILPSRWPENEPVTLLEAIASGTAQLASRIGGNQELVEEDRSGLLFTPGSTGELATAMARFVTEPDLARRFGARNADRRDSFDARSTADALRDVYDDETSPEPAADFVVICVGAFPPEHLDLMLHRLHIAESTGSRLRFVWHAWACASVWRAARLVWFWDRGSDPALELAARALRRGIPILAPESSALADLANVPGVVGTYRTLLEALGTITALPETAGAERRAMEAGPAAARLLNAIRPRDSFHMAIGEDA